MSQHVTCIVGGNRGIGLAVTQRVLEENQDHVLVAIRANPPSNELSELQKQYGDRLSIIAFDVKDEESAKLAADGARTSFPAIDTLYVVAGINEGQGQISQLRAEDFKVNFDTNVIGVHNAIKAFYPLVLASSSTRKQIIIVSSIFGSLGSVDFLGQVARKWGQPSIRSGSYAISKAAVNMLGRQWADLLEPQGVSVLLVHPGLVATRMTEGLPGAIPPAESAAGLVKLSATVDPAKSGAGIHNYDGKLYPW